jgi:MoaA/NifB/PqqE/SkfB family radical SAM enzyme
MVTDRCNSKCIHCNIWDKEYTENPLTPYELETALSDDLFKGVEYVLCSGGEPTVRKDIVDIIMSIHRALPKAKIQLSTNGLLPERVIDVAKACLQENIALDIGISLDGIGEEHDRIRGVEGNFEKTDYLIHELVKLRTGNEDKLCLAVGVTLSEHTFHSLLAIRAYAEKLCLSVTEAWLNESTFYDNIGIKNPNPDLIGFVQSQPDSPIKDLWLKELAGKSIAFPCFAMYTFCVLKCNGDIIPCLNRFYESAGNVRINTPTEIWHSKDMKRVRQYVEDCQGCLNTWGCGWSLSASYYPVIISYLKHKLL